MSASVFGAQAAVTMLNRAFNNASPANAVFNNQVATAGATDASQFAFATTFAQGFASLSNADLASRVMGNLGMLPNDALLAAFTDYLAANGAESRGVIVLQLSQILSTMENATGDLAIYAPQAKAWNTEVEKSFIYSSSASSTTSYNGDFPVTPVNVGQTFTLTDGVDNVSGTGGNDTIVAGTQAKNETLNAGDQINGGAGTDTLNIYAGAANFGTASIQNVEVINVYENAGLNVSTNAGVTQAWSLGGVAATMTANLAQTVGFGNQSTGGASVATFVGATGTADAATIALKDAGKIAAYASIAVAGIEALTINATGKNDVGTLNAANAASLTVTGDGSLAAVAAGGSFKTVDASANTGGVTLDLSGLGANNIKVTGGTGNDEITVDYLNLNKADVINLGDGTDTLGFSVTNVAFNSGATVSALAGVTGVENLKVNGALTFVADAALLAQTGFVINSTGQATLTNLANTDTVTYSAATAVTNTLGLELGQNTLNLNMKGGAAIASGTTAVTGSSIVNIDSSGKAGVGANTLVLTTGDNNLFNITGSNDLTLSVTGTGGVTGQTVNGAAFTGKLNVTGSALADSITGGSANDTIMGGKGADKMTGGAGSDTFVFDGAAGQTQSGAVFGSFDTITDFTVGTDKLQFTNAIDVASTQQALVQAAVTALAAGSGGAAIAGAMAAANTTNLGVSFATFGGDTYVLFELNGAGAGVAADDVFIKLTGVTTAPTFAADVVA